jgi:Protein of unknown function (DUF4058)
MPSPLPGMNPFLEANDLWSEFHSRLIVAIADSLSESLSQEYRVAVEKRVYLSQGEEIQERYLEIREVANGQLVTVIELLSPKNKKSNEGLDAYLQKRQQIMVSKTHLVEIDLLRDGEALPILDNIKSDYRISVHRSSCRPKAELYAFGK